MKAKLKCGLDWLLLLGRLMVSKPLFERFQGIKLQNLANEQIECIGVELF